MKRCPSADSDDVYAFTASSHRIIRLPFCILVFMSSGTFNPFGAIPSFSSLGEIGHWTHIRRSCNKFGDDDRNCSASQS